MAQTVTLQGLRDQIIHSFYGRKFGLSFGTPGSTTVVGKEDSPDFLVGIKAVRVPVTALTSATTVSSTADQIPNYGICTINVTGAAGATAFNPVSPVPGASVQIYNLTTNSHSIYVNNSTMTTGVTMVTIGSSGAGGSSAATNFTLSARNWAELVGLSTAIWALRTFVGSTITTGTSVSSIV